MAALTLDHLSGGRFILGLGASGPQVAEGWYGDDYRKPLARTREYVEIVRQVLAREAPVELHGEHLPAAAARWNRPGQAAQVDHAPVACRPPDLPRGRGSEERVAVGGDRRRLAADVLRAEERRLLPRRPGRGFRPPRRAPHCRHVRGCVPRARDHRRRRRGRGRHVPAGARALHRRHGCPRGELPQQRVRAHGLRRRSQADPGPLSRRQEGGGRGRGADPSSIEDVALVGPKREDPRRPRDVAESAVTTMVVSGATEQLRTIAELVHG